ncbi:hypothetical protein AAZX31_12G111500 [Glycine max]
MKLMNIVVYEQCDCPSSPYITEYIKIIDFLINTGKDVNILVEKKIIVNLLGDDDALATMVNNLCSNITMIHINSEYRSLCYQLNASTIAAIVLLLLTFIQTVSSISSLFKG